MDTLTQEHLRDPFPLREIQKLAKRLLHLTSLNGTSRKRGDTISPRAPTPRHRPVRTGKEWNQHPSSPRYHPRDRFPALQSQDHEGAGRLHSLRTTENQAGTGTKGTGGVDPPVQIRRGERAQRRGCRKTSVFLSRETRIPGNFVGRIKGAKCPFDLQFLTWDFS